MSYRIVRFCFLWILVIGMHYSYAQQSFIENKGQWHKNVLYKSDFKTGAIFLEKAGFMIVMHDPEMLKKISMMEHGGTKEPYEENLVLKSFAYRVRLDGANVNAFVQGEKPLNTYSNYFLGDKPENWAASCREFQEVLYKDVYPGIDMRLYNGGGSIKYDFIVHPGANPDRIKIFYDGPELSIKNNEVHVKTPVGTVRELSPYTYQYGRGQKSEVKASYILDGSGKGIRFKLGSYDKNATLVIDPSLIFSSFTGSTADNWGYTATPGRDGSFYAGGIVFGTGYKVSPGAYSTVYGGGILEDNSNGFDIGIFKFSANGSQRLYATYLGGLGNEQPHSMIEDNQGNLIVAGRTNSSNYPRTMPQQGSGGGYDIIVTKFNATGTGLIGSVKLGGSGDDGLNVKTKTSPGGADETMRNYGDDARSEVIVDAANNIYLASCTKSTNFMATFSSPIQSTYGGGRQDGVILKLNPSISNILFVTLFGGTGTDACFVLNINPVNGLLYVGGATTSTTGLPGDKTGVIQGTYGGGITDGFVTMMDLNGNAVLKTTYLNGAGGGTDLVYGLKIDSKGFPYVMGTTTGNWPIVNAPYSNAGAKQFISKLRPDLSAFVYSTIFGKNDPSPSISPSAFMVDRCENVYVSGWGGETNATYNTGSTAGLPQVNPITGIPAADGSDFYFFVLKKDAQACLFASHFGSNGSFGDHVDGGTSRFDEEGVIYQGMCANCGGVATGGVPVTPGVIFPINGSTNCNMAAVKIAMNLAGVSSNIAIRDTLKGCAPYTANFYDMNANAVTYYWLFGDGTPQSSTTTFTNSHVYTNAGTYTVRLIAEDLNTCNQRDTSYLTIQVSDKVGTPDFSFVKLPPCANLTYSFTNTSTANNANFGTTSFQWLFGDNSAPLTAGMNTVQHTYAAPGSYNVSLILRDTVFCNSPDTVTKTIRISSNVKASFNVSDTGCVPYTAQFTNTSNGGVQYEWLLSNGTVFSTQENPSYTFNTVGTHRVRLVAIDPNSCNIRDTSGYFTITVLPQPDAQFTWGPNPPQINVPVRFTNMSTGATQYLWVFGDGDSSTTVNPIHEYNSTGNFQATLYAMNDQGCRDSVTIVVNTLIENVLDIPNAFTPGAFGENGIFKVRGYGISKMTFKIFNRWGEMVFMSTSKNTGWDGTYKGKPQPMEVYTYTLDAELGDGTKVRRSGDITLIR